MSEQRRDHYPGTQTAQPGDSGEFQIPPHIEDVTNFSPEQRSKLGRRIMIGAAATLATIVAGVGISLATAHNTGAEGPAKGNRPAATGPAVPGAEKPSAATSTTEAAPVTFDASNYPFKEANGQEVIGLTAFEKKDLVMNSDPLFSDPNRTQETMAQGANAVVSQFVANMELCAANSYRPGVDPYTSSNLGLEAFMSMVDPSAGVDTSNSGTLAQWFIGTAEAGHLPGQPSSEVITDTVRTNQVSMVAQDERFNGSDYGLAITTAVRLNETSGAGTGERYVQLIFTQERQDANSAWQWKLTGFTDDGNGSSADPSVYGPDSPSN